MLSVLYRTPVIGLFQKLRKNFLSKKEFCHLSASSSLPSQMDEMKCTGVQLSYYQPTVFVINPPVHRLMTSDSSPSSCRVFNIKYQSVAYRATVASSSVRPGPISGSMRLLPLSKRPLPCCVFRAQ